MEDVKYTIEALCIAIRAVIENHFPKQERFDLYPYSMQDLVNQIVFELIKEEYKNNATVNSIQHYINKYDPEADNRKYTRAIQYAQFYRDENNRALEDNVGIRSPLLEAVDMSGSNRFCGYSVNLCEFLQFKMQAECKLLNKTHEGQISKAKKVSESDFQKLFDDYSQHISDLEPAINDVDPENIISRIMAYYALETHFLFEYKYKVTLVAEHYKYSKDIPIELLSGICSLMFWIPDASWCPGSVVADLCIIHKWDKMADIVYSTENTSQQDISDFIVDCKRIKGRLLCPELLEKFLVTLSRCSFEDKLMFLKEHFWFWDYSPQYEWDSRRIRYYRWLDDAITRDFGKPHIK